MASKLRTLAWLFAAALAGCGSAPPPKSAPPAATARAPLPPRCDPSAAQGVIGLPVDAGVIEKARAAAGADMARAVRADQVGVQDFRAGRLNLYLDAQRRVARVGCG